MRLDKWLWCARFFKSRSLAAQAVRAGRVHAAGRRVKPSFEVGTGEELRIRRGPWVFTVTIRRLAPARLPAAAAAELYEESEDSARARQSLAARLKAERGMHPRTEGRPSKRDRRRLLQFKKTRK